MNSIDEHVARQQALSAQLLDAKHAHLGKATSNLFRHRDNGNGAHIDVRNFNHVIAIDPAALTADVEGMITYEALADATLKFGLMPTVVPEFKTITAGGAATGIGLEATSFRYGFVHETIQELDVLLPSGEVRTCSKTKNADLFYGFPNSYGTLGYALRLRITLIPVRPYVKIQHRRCNDFASYFAAMQSACDEPVDFIDGAIFGPDEMYLTTGTFANAAPYLSDYTYMNIYYQSLRHRSEDYLTVRDFLWRWDTDWYWGSKKFGAENPLIRFVLGPNRLRSSFYWKLRSKLNQTPFWNMLTPIAKYETVIQDVDIPIEAAAEFMEFQSKEIGITPIWACPVRAFDKNVQYPLYAMAPETTYVNLGFWNIVRTKYEPGHYNRLVEQKVSALHGRKILYSESYYPPDEFNALYGGAAYVALKKKYDPQGALDSLYEKCVANKR